jgi:molybdopterin synthase sulfur carrier subunit
VKKTVIVRYFAALREQRGVDEERVDTSAATARELYEELRALHGFSLTADRLRVAVNDEFGPWTSEVRAGDSLVFLPPVAGG